MSPVTAAYTDWTEPAMFHGTAATVVLLRDAPAGLQVLLLERPRHRGSFAGAWVFPGGVVDAEDYDPTADDDVELAAARQAGVRETAEETGLALELADLQRLSCWVPPPEAPRRYKTWFFLAEAPDGDVRLSPDEHVDAVWLAPAEALERHRAGTMILFPPTWVTLHGLLGTDTAAQALAGAAAAAPETYATRQLAGHEPPAMVWHGDAQYPGVADAEAPHGDSAVPPASPLRHRLIMDQSGWTYERTK